MQKFKTLKSKENVEKETLLLLLPLLFMAIYYYGMRVAVIAVISITICYMTELICNYLRIGNLYFKNITPILVGTVLALMMPATVSYNVMIISAIITIVIGEQVFGGDKNRIFVAPAVGYLFSAICWKNIVTSYPKPGIILTLDKQITDSLTQSFTKNLNDSITSSASNFDILLGNITGPMGSTHIFILLVCALIMILRRNLSALSFFSALGVIIFFGAVLPTYSNEINQSILYEISSGMVLFGLIFVTGDYATTPARGSARFLYGIIIGLLTVMFRRIGNVENGIVYATIIANPIGIALDKSALSFSKILKEYMARIKNKKGIADGK